MSFKNDLDNIGFAYIAEKKENIEDSKVYYEILDFDCGFVCDYKNEGLLFTSLYRKIGHAYELSNRPKNKVCAFYFFASLAHQNAVFKRITIKIFKNLICKS